MTENLIAASIVGATIKDVQRSETVCTVFFDNDCILNIYNPCDFFGISGGINQSKHIVERIEETGEKFSILMAGGAYISIGMKDSDYEGPEAFTLGRPDGIFVICP